MLLGRNDATLWGWSIMAAGLIAPFVLIVPWIVHDLAADYAPFGVEEFLAASIFGSALATVVILNLTALIDIVVARTVLRRGLVPRRLVRGVCEAHAAAVWPGVVLLMVIIATALQIVLVIQARVTGSDPGGGALPILLVLPTGIVWHTWWLVMAVQHVQRREWRADDPEDSGAG